MKRFLIKCYNNSNWLSDTNFIILTLDEKQIKDIENIQDRLRKCFPTEFAEVHLYNMDFEVYSWDMTKSYYSEEILNWINTPNDSQEEVILLEDNNFDYSSILDSESENDIVLDTYMLKVRKNTIQCICYPKYDGSVEIFSEEININEL